MAPTLTTDDVVLRIAAERAHVHDRGAVRIRLEPGSAIVVTEGNPPGAGARAER